MTAASAGKVLLVDDDAANRESAMLLLEGEGFQVIAAANGAEAIHHLTDGVTVIITDLVMPETDGMDLLRAAREETPHTPVIMMTGHGSEAAAVNALKAGAFHYLTKPVNPDELLNLIRQAAEKYMMASEIAALHEQLNERYGFSNIIGKSDAMRKVFEKIRMVADTRSTVLVEGESGTGKELVSRAIHCNSPRRSKPFVVINCAAMPEALIESELFGHEKGAFTGAIDRRIGKFQAANGGTLLIDEIGEMHLDLQSKLLRAIETRGVTPIGSNKESEVDVRIVASTNRNLEELVRQGRFREDLLYRLRVVTIRLPPLRDRREDIPLLVRAFIDELAKDNHRPVRDISPEAMALLTGFDWPGNVRQLRNLLESVIVLSTREVIDVVDLPEPIRSARPARAVSLAVKPGVTITELEKEAIRQTLEQTNGNRSEASRRLGISVRTLQRKIKEYGFPS